MLDALECFQNIKRLETYLLPVVSYMHAEYRPEICLQSCTLTEFHIN